MGFHLLQLAAHRQYCSILAHAQRHGSQQEQVTSDEFNNWFPHIALMEHGWFFSYDHSVTGHPENKDVTLRLMSLSDKKSGCWPNSGRGTISFSSVTP